MENPEDEKLEDVIPPGMTEDEFMEAVRRQAEEQWQAHQKDLKPGDGVSFEVDLDRIARESEE